MKVMRIIFLFALLRHLFLDFLDYFPGSPFDPNGSFERLQNMLIARPVTGWVKHLLTGVLAIIAML